MNIFRKALERGLTPANIICWLTQLWLVRWGRLWGTLALRVKARLLGVRLGRGVAAHGPVGLMRWPGGEIGIGASGGQGDAFPFITGNGGLIQRDRAVLHDD